MVNKIKDKLCKFMSRIAPKRLLYWMVIRAWSHCHIEKYPQNMLNEITWVMVCKYLDEQIGKSL
jgi:hypothetical protein